MPVFDFIGRISKPYGYLKGIRIKRKGFIIAKFIGTAPDADFVVQSLYLTLL